jgi:hypothetical protein
MVAIRSPRTWRRKTARNSSECSFLWTYWSSWMSNDLLAVSSPMASSSGGSTPSGVTNAFSHTAKGLRIVVWQA